MLKGVHWRFSVIQLPGARIGGTVLGNQAHAAILVTRRRRAATAAGLAVTRAVAATARVTVATAARVAVAVTAVGRARAVARTFAVVAPVTGRSAAATTVVAVIATATAAATVVELARVVRAALTRKLHVQLAALELLALHALDGVFGVALLHEAHERKAAGLGRTARARDVRVADLTKPVMRLLDPNT